MAVIVVLFSAKKIQKYWKDSVYTNKVALPRQKNSNENKMNLNFNFNELSISNDNFEVLTLMIGVLTFGGSRGKQVLKLSRHFWSACFWHGR